MPVKLPPNYLRVLSSLTEIVEREAWELLQLLENPGRQGEVLQTTVSFTPEERKEKMLRLETLLEENRRFFRELKAEPAIYPEKQIFNAKVTQLWTILHDSYPDKMKGYGPLHKEEKEWIEEHVNRLLDIINELKR
ncbi:MAG: hypothetical protein J7K46_07600 [Bacteroidales bacterium]|nr:hypothetical protein [Bacteroidales bacterium]